MLMCLLRLFLLLQRLGRVFGWLLRWDCKGWWSEMVEFHFAAASSGECIAPNNAVLRERRPHRVVHRARTA